MLIRSRFLAVVAVCIAVAGCAVDAPGLFEPGESGGEGVVSVAVPDTLVRLYEGDTVRVAVEGVREGSLLLVDGERRVLWRSPTGRVEDGILVVGIGEIAVAVPRVVQVGLLVEVEVAGERRYAGLDGGVVAMLDSAALGTAVVYPGRLVAPGFRVATVAEDANGGVVWGGGDGRLIRFDLLGMETGEVAIPAGGVALAAVNGSLAALVAGGTEVRRFAARGVLAATGGEVLPVLRLHVRTPVSRDSTGAVEEEAELVPLRPYAEGVGLVCGDPDCGSPDVVLPTTVDQSGLKGLGGTPVGALRLLRGGGGGSPVALPRFDGSGFGPDTLASRVSVIAPTVVGSDSLRAYRADVARCPLLGLGGGLVSGTVGRVYVAARAVSPCGGASRILRVDDPFADSPVVSALGERNQLGEDRIGVLTGLRASRSGEWVLAVGIDRVWVLDGGLRVRAVVEVPGVRGAAWVDGDVGDRFVVVGAGGLQLWSVGGSVPLASVPSGFGGEVVAVRTAGGAVVAGRAEGRAGLVFLSVGF